MVELADRELTLADLRQKILEQRGASDHGQLQVVLLTQIVAVVGQTAEAVMHRQDSEGLLRQAVDQVKNFFLIHQAHIAQIQMIQDTGREVAGTLEVAPECLDHFIVRTPDSQATLRGMHSCFHDLQHLVHVIIAAT